MNEQLYLELGEAISTLTGRTLARVHPQLGVKVSPCGEVFVPGDKWHKAHWTFGCKNSDGYRQVLIGGKSFYVHRLVVETFLGPIPEGYQIDHINRDRSSNMVTNLRICTPSENRRNCADHDRVEAQGRTHYYEDAKQANRENCARYYETNRDAVHEQQASYRQTKRMTHRNVRFSDGSKHWVTLEEALELLTIPLSQRTYKE